MTRLSCGHEAPAEGPPLPSDLDGLRICPACHGAAARAVVDRLQPGQTVALRLRGAHLVTYHGQPIMVVPLFSPTHKRIWAIDMLNRVWKGERIDTREQMFLLTLTPITAKASTFERIEEGNKDERGR